MIQEEKKEHWKAKEARLAREAKGDFSTTEKEQESITENNDLEIEEDNKEEKQKEPTVLLSDVKKMMAEFKEDILSNLPSQPQQVQAPQFQQYIPQVIGIEDIPELRNWERKERRYEIIDSTVKSQSESIHTRPTPQRALNYINKETNTQHAIRYSTNQMSFFVEKQSTEVGSVLSPDIIFTFGMLNTGAEDILLQQFLHIHPDFNKKFRLHNPNELADKRINNRKIRHQAEDLVYNFGLIENRMIASLLFESYIPDWSEKIITDELLTYIETNAVKYIALTEDPTLKKKGVAKTAESEGLLIYQNYRWLNKDKQVLVEVPKHKDQYDVIVEYFETELGRILFDYLRNS
jgi:hypothetical protein